MSPKSFENRGRNLLVCIMSLDIMYMFTCQHFFFLKKNYILFYSAENILEPRLHNHVEFLDHILFDTLFTNFDVFMMFYILSFLIFNLIIF